MHVSVSVSVSVSATATATATAHEFGYEYPNGGLGLTKPTSYLGASDKFQLGSVD